jgi:hypothetical protein
MEQGNNEFFTCMKGDARELIAQAGKSLFS